jgi:hypothetical protein
MLSFKDFLTEATLAMPKLNQRPKAMEAFIKKLVNKEPFVLAGQTKPTLVIQPDPAWLKQLVKTKKLTTDFIPQIDKSQIKLSSLQKTVELGSTGRTGTEKEEVQRGSLDKQIKEARNGAPITVVVGNDVYKNCIGVVNTPGTPKSDFEIVNTDGKAVIFVSHKDGTTPSGFSQWSGISKVISTEEVANFCADVKRKTRGVMPTGTTYYRELTDNTVRNKACFGNDFNPKGKPIFSRNNVNCILQGEVKLEPVKGKRNVFALTANKVWLHGVTPDEGYTPVLMAIYKGDRSDCGVKGARFNIYPRDGRGKKQLI